MMKKMISKKNKMRLVFYPVFLSLVVFFAWPQVQARYFDNGFDLSDTLIDQSQIFHGGPAKDGIPSIDKPVFLTANKVEFLSDLDRILGIELNGITKAYPIKILNHHEIVNDYIGKQKIVISYCPLCGTGMAFNARVNGKDLEFGVSGLLYNSDVLLYDRQTHSLWSQILSQAISGTFKSTKLQQIPLQHNQWGLWKQKHPQTLVLSEKTGFNRNYQQSPYHGYEDSESVYFPIKSLDKRYHPKEWVVGLRINNKSKVYPFSELVKHTSPLQDNFAGVNFNIDFNPASRSAKILDINNQEIPSTIGFWFAWLAFYPDSTVYQARTLPTKP